MTTDDRIVESHALVQAMLDQLARCQTPVETWETTVQRLEWYLQGPEAILRDLERQRADAEAERR